jgi:CheY-like chemotaxis protein/anti-sigma regulatory factor (Ser/Thr protein kinase)
MNGVIGLMDLVKLEGLSDQQTIWLDSMKKSADALLTVIDDILDFTKIEAGHLEITPVDFDLRPCVESVLYLFSEQASTKNIALNLHIDDSVPAVLHADQGRVRQILTNLLSNAVKFTPQGTISIYITTAPGAELGSCRFTITDTGIGIPEDEYDKVFTRFQQVDQGLTRRYGGSGLGLSICRQLLSLMGGSIGFSSDLGYGSRFWFDFPIKRGASTGLPAQSDRPTTELARPDSSAVSDGSESLSVLIAEDSEVNQFIILELLKQCGVSGVVVENGAKAVEAMAKQRYDLILMDVSMPVMDGLEATQRIRSQESTTDQRATIIGLSAHAMADDVARAMDAGMDSYITKPVSLTDLQEALQTLSQPNGGT